MPRDQNDTNKRYEQILNLVNAEATFQQIAEKLHISKSTLSVTLKTMEKKGLVQRRKEGKMLMLSLPHAIQNSLATPSKLPTYRIHDLWLTYKLKDSIGNDTTRLVASIGLAYTPRNMANHTDSCLSIDSYEAILSPSSIEIHLPDLDNLPLEADLKLAATGLMAKAEGIILKMEDKLGLKVIRIDRDTIIAKISQLHIALKDHKFAETINEKGEKLYVYVDGELRVIVDKSHGLHEYEAINAKFAIDDGQKLGKLTEAVITDKFDYEKDHELLHGILKTLDIEKQFYGKHNLLIEVLLEKEMQSLPKQRQAYYKSRLTSIKNTRQSKLSSFASKPSEDVSKLSEALDKALKEGSA
jgi:DNA-binding transcriptional ArsR family regulator